MRITAHAFARDARELWKRMVLKNTAVVIGAPLKREATVVEKGATPADISRVAVALDVIAIQRDKSTEWPLLRQRVRPPLPAVLLACRASWSAVVTKRIGTTGCWDDSRRGCAASLSLDLPATPLRAAAALAAPPEILVSTCGPLRRTTS